MAQISTGSLVQLCRRLATSSRAGVDARKTWENEAKYGSGAYRRNLTLVSDGVARGDTVAESLRECEGYFPSLMCELVEVGERTGKTDAIYAKLAEHYEHQAQLTRNFLMGIAWPMFQLLIGIVVVGGLIGVLGVIGGNNIDILGLGFKGVRGMLLFWANCALLAMLVALGVSGVMRGWFGDAPLALAMRIPGIGAALTYPALARLTWTLAMALEAGIDAKRSVQLCLRASQNPLYLGKAPGMLQAISDNRQFIEAFQEAEVFPLEFLHSLENAEIAGATSESLLVLAKEFEDRAKTALRILTGAIGVLVWMGVGLLIILMIYRMFQEMYLKPINDIMDQINKGTI